MNEEKIAVGLGWFIIGLGLLEIGETRRLARWLGMEERSDLLRVFGFCEVGAGIGLLTQSNHSSWLWERFGGDALDIVALLASNPKRGNAVCTLAMVLGITALDVLCALRLGQKTDKRATRQKAYLSSRGSRGAK